MINTTDQPHTSNKKPSRTSGSPGVAAMVHDTVALMELQGKLLVHDLHQLRSGSGLPLLMLAMGVVLAFATVPVLLLGLSWMLATMADWPVWQATLVAALAGGVGPALLLLIVGWKMIQKKAAVMSRSTTELRRNTDWLKRKIKSAL